MSKGPVLIEIPETPESEASRPQTVTMSGDAPSPADAPPIADDGAEMPSGRVMQQIANGMGRDAGSPLMRWFWRLLGALVMTFVSLAVWSYLGRLMAAYPLIGMAVSTLLAVFVLVCLIIVLRELASFARLRRIDTIQKEAADARANNDLAEAQRVARKLLRLYSGRDDARWGMGALRDRLDEQMDAHAVLDLIEDRALSPLDAEAEKTVQAAARQVATVTALVPLAFADVIAALTANLRMIRRVAEIYGGRSGVFGNWRLARSVFAHLVATGAVAIGDDMLEPVIGGGLLGRLSRRFGEGLVNGALTARVGIAAMEVCRPMAFSADHRPKVRAVIKNALTGIVTSAKT